MISKREQATEKVKIHNEKGNRLLKIVEQEAQKGNRLLEEEQYKKRRKYR